ncbi:MAG: hypothetical protein M3Q52_01505 [Pseudomonadota bacterium]|nr:hypothetical protein [Pseudomonadota bacterium]
MTSEPKAFASLSSGLLARKGAARPAMRPQGFGQSGAGLEDLGWNDMGFEPPRAAVAPIRDVDHDAFGEAVAEPLRPSFAGLTPIDSPVHSQQAEIAGRMAAEVGSEDEIGELDETAEIYEPEAEEALAAPAIVEVAPIAVAKVAAAVVAVTPVPAPRRAPRPRSAAGSKAKAAFTLRLDPARHLKLRLACAVGGQSAQQIVTEALDQLLAGMPELDAMAATAKRKE